MNANLLRRVLSRFFPNDSVEINAPAQENFSHEEGEKAKAASSPSASISPVEPDSRDIGLVDAVMSGWFLQDRGELLEGFAIGPKDVVLDVGCGEGGAAGFCAHQGARMIFSDIDVGKVSAVRRKLADAGFSAERYHGFVSDSDPLPLIDGCVSHVLCMEVLEHVDDPSRLLRELYRVGQPGARYLLTVPDATSEQVLKQVAPSIFFEKPNHIRIFSRDDFERVVKESGLQIERQTTSGFYWAMWWMLFCACEQKNFAPPWHPLLAAWSRTWDILLQQPQGPRLKQVLDELLPKSQAIIARKPL